MVAEDKIPKSVISRVGDRWLLDDEFVEAVGLAVDEGSEVLDAVQVLAQAS
jgi:hypothetical protein